MFCGIDVGTQGVRAVLMDEIGVLHGVGTAPLAPGRRNDREHVQNPASWWDALVASVRTALAHAAAADGGPVVVDAVALDATSGSVLVEHCDGTAAGDALMYDDARAAEQAGRAQQVGAGLWDALGYRMQRTWALPKVMWLVEHAQLAMGDRVVHQSDHLVARLAGHRVATDVSNALKTGADLRDATWPAAVHAELGLRPGLLPDLVLPGQIIGRVGAAAAAATGLTAGAPIRAGMTDGCAAQIAAGALQAGSWSSALGTTLVVKGATAELIRDPSGAVYSHRHPDGGWLPGGASSSGAGAVAQAFPTAGPDELARLTRHAAGLVPVAAIGYPLTGRGERFPFVAPDAVGFGISERDGDALRFAALCQSIAYVERLAYDVLGHLGADVSGPVSLTGGATRNGWWNQLRTDVLARPTLVPASAEAAVGMAVLAAAEPGRLTETASRTIRVDARFEPDAARGAVLREGYRALVGELADRGWLDAELAGAVLSGSVRTS